MGALGEQFRLTAEQVKAQEDAMDRLHMKYKLTADYTERQIALLEREAAAHQKVIDTENKRLNRDKEGFSIDPTTNKRVEIGVENQRSVYEKAKSQGLSEAQSLQVANQFMTASGEPIGWNAGGRNGAMQGENWGTVLQKAIDKIVLSNAANAAPGATSSRTININIGGRTTAVRVASQSDASALTSVLRQLESSYGTAA